MVFELWDYIPTLVWILAVTGRGLIDADKVSNYTAMSRPDSTQTLYSKDASSIQRLGNSPSSPEDGSGGMFFYNSDDMNLIAPTAVAANTVSSSIENGRRARNQSPPETVPLPRSQSWGVLGKRFEAPRSIAPVISWLATERPEEAKPLLDGVGTGAGGAASSGGSLVPRSYGENGSSYGSLGALLSGASNARPSPQMPWPSHFPGDAPLVPPSSSSFSSQWQSSTPIIEYRQQETIAAEGAGGGAVSGGIALLPRLRPPRVDTEAANHLTGPLKSYSVPPYRL